MLTLVLTVATILGGLAALWYFWEKIVSLVRPRLVPPLLPQARLRIELPEKVNPLGHHGGAAFVPAWSVRVRLIAEGDVRPLDVVELGVTEDGVGPWTIDEVFLRSTGKSLPFPIRLNPSAEFWVRARSPRAFESKPASVGTLTLWFRDHTQGRYEYVVDHPPVA